MRSKNASWVLLSVLAVLGLAASVTIIWNTVRLNQEVEMRTQRYISDVMSQLTRDIDNRLEQVAVDLKMAGENLLQTNRYEPEGIDGYLESVARNLSFTGFVVVWEDGGTYQFGIETSDVQSLEGVQASFAGEDGICVLDKQSILYTVPILDQVKVRGVLGGIRDKENMQALIQSDSFSGESLTCIVDREGKVVISPTELAPFLRLDEVFQEEPDGKVARSIQKMKRDMAARQAGVFRFEASNGSDVMLAYNPLDTYDWVLLSLVSSDVISAGIDYYMGQTTWVVGLVLVLMIVIFLLLFLGQRIHYKQLEQIAFTDRVTGGMNNAAFQLKCETLLAGAAPGAYSVLLLHLKGFKLINEQFGSGCGDEVLRAVMGILQAAAEGRGCAARADGDNFFLCVEEGDPDGVCRLVDGLARDMAAWTRTFNADKQAPFRFVLQPGAYIVDEPGLEITIIQDRAKTACKDRTAAEDGICKFYNPILTQRQQKEQELNGLFQDALERRDFQVYFQPKVHLPGGTVGGAEALVRWVHPQRGMIYPSDFIPLFESNGNICKLDLYVFEEVCRTLRRWEDEGRAAMTVSVNLSRMHFRRPDFLKEFAAVAEAYQIPRGRIEFELTESIFFDDWGIKMVKSLIEEMHRLGFRCSMDDFGVGYSSLGLLVDFDIDVIKLDRQFFLDVTKERARDVVETIVDLARKIGAETVAEGIETPEQLEFLSQVRCDMVQGYIYAKPLPIFEFEAWLAR